MSEEEKEAIEFYKGKEITFKVDGDMKEFFEAIGIKTEEDSFEKHSIRFETLLKLIAKQQKEIERLKEIDIRKGKHTKENNTMEYKKMNSANKTGVTRCLYR